MPADAIGVIADRSNTRSDNTDSGAAQVNPDAIGTAIAAGMDRNCSCQMSAANLCGHGSFFVTVCTTTAIAAQVFCSRGAAHSTWSTSSPLRSSTARCRGTDASNAVRLNELFGRDENRLELGP